MVEFLIVGFSIKSYLFLEREEKRHLICFPKVSPSPQRQAARGGALALLTTLHVSFWFPVGSNSALCHPDLPEGWLTWWPRREGSEFSQSDWSVRHETEFGGGSVAFAGSVFLPDSDCCTVLGAVVSEKTPSWLCWNLRCSWWPCRQVIPVSCKPVATGFIKTLGIFVLGLDRRGGV